MPSFADLKSKASSVATSGVEKVQNLKDRNTSVPLKKTNWDPYSGQPAPPPPPPRSLVNQRTKPTAPAFLPPPSRTGASSSSSSSSSPALPERTSPGPAPPLPSRGASSTPPTLPRRSAPAGPPLPPPSRTGAAAASPRPAAAPGPPPPVVRSTRPDLGAAPPPPAAAPEPPRAASASRSAGSEAIDWANLSQEDKEVFFAWLDEFFSRHLGIVVGPGPRCVSTPSSRGSAFGAPPPPLNVSSKPTSWAQRQGIATPAGSRSWIANANATDLPNDSGSGSMATGITSYPPAPKGSGPDACAASDLAAFFAPSSSWDTAWYADDGVPPPVRGNKGTRTVSAWASRGDVKTTRCGVLFSDLSVFWGSVSFSPSQPANQASASFARAAAYLPRPPALDGDKLREASEVYGETIALFAEGYEGTGTYCARGECWDLANEALKYFDQFDYVPKPVPSIGRTHGCLLFEAKVGKDGRRVGRWRGGDDRVRRGDIVEWRTARVTMGANGTSYAVLGDPEHTAVVVAESSAVTRAPGASDEGFAVLQEQLGTLVVVEQSVGQPPERREYDLSGLEEGEVWVYRPVGMRVYLGLEALEPGPPEGHARLRTVC